MVASDEICSENKFSNSYLCLPEAFAGYSDRFLRMHSRTDFSDYCLSYLLTHLDFDATLGVAYVGGVCANHGLVRDEVRNEEKQMEKIAGFSNAFSPYRKKIRTPRRWRGGAPTPASSPWSTR